MNSYSNSGGAPTQPPTNDPNPTRYFPPQETPGPEVPASGVPYNAGQAYGGYAGTEQPGTAPQGNGGAPGGYAQPQYGTYGQVQTGTQPYHTPAGKRDRDRSILAMALIGGGLLFLLDQFSFFPSFGDMVLLLIGGIFMYAYFTTKPGYRIGFLIPGSILLGIGAGQFLQGFGPIDAIFGSSISAITLGLGFCTIWFFERKHWWALIPGGVILLGGLSSIFRLFALWPIVLIALGAYLLYDQSRRRPR
ncbi:MAG: hypothetical protein WCD37_19930 [Chloroflexia bacterium]